jgi:hypothetical protein
VSPIFANNESRQKNGGLGISSFQQDSSTAVARATAVSLALPVGSYGLSSDAIADATTEPAY